MNVDAWLVTKGMSDFGDCSGITLEVSSRVSQDLLEYEMWKLKNFGGGVRRFETIVRQRILFCGSSVRQQRYSGKPKR